MVTRLKLFYPWPEVNFMRPRIAGLSVQMQVVLRHIVWLHDRIGNLAGFEVVTLQRFRNWPRSPGGDAAVDDDV